MTAWTGDSAGAGAIFGSEGAGLAARGRLKYAATLVSKPAETVSQIDSFRAGPGGSGNRTMALL